MPATTGRNMGAPAEKPWAQQGRANRPLPPDHRAQLSGPPSTASAAPDPCGGIGQSSSRDHDSDQEPHRLGGSGSASSARPRAWLCRVASECAPPGKHLVEHRAEREDVRTRVDWFPLRLFGRHVAAVPRMVPSAVLRGWPAHSVSVVTESIHRIAVDGLGQFRQSEVENFDGSLVRSP